MRKKNYKGRCEKRILPKCKTVFKSYDPIQNAYADILESNPDVVEISKSTWSYWICLTRHFAVMLSDFTTNPQAIHGWTNPRFPRNSAKLKDWSNSFAIH